jgi:hypothetical protein
VSFGNVLQSSFGQSLDRQRTPVCRLFSGAAKSALERSFVRGRNPQPLSDLFRLNLSWALSLLSRPTELNGLHSHAVGKWICIRRTSPQAGKQQELLRLFPEIRTEDGKIDFDRLKRTLRETVDPGKERFGMNWPGKADCFNWRTPASHVVSAFSVRRSVRRESRWCVPSHVFGCQSDFAVTRITPASKSTSSHGRFSSLVPLCAVPLAGTP